MPYIAAKWPPSHQPFLADHSPNTSLRLPTGNSRRYYIGDRIYLSMLLCNNPIRVSRKRIHIIAYT